MSNMHIEGVVEDYFVKPTRNGSYRHAVKVNGSVYSAFADDDKPRANEGDAVEFPAEENNGYFNIKGQVKVTKRASGHQKPKQQYAQNEDKRQGQIIRQNAMTQANSLVAGLAQDGRFADMSQDEVAAEVIRLADKYFFPYAQDGTKPE